MSAVWIVWISVIAVVYCVGYVIANAMERKDCEGNPDHARVYDDAHYQCIHGVHPAVVGWPFVVAVCSTVGLPVLLFVGLNKISKKLAGHE